MKFTMVRTDGGTSVGAFLDGMDRAGIELDPGTMIDAADVTHTIIEVNPEAYVVRMVTPDGARHDRAHRRFRTCTAYIESGPIEALTPLGYRWHCIEQVIKPRGGIRAPLTEEEVDALKLNPDAEDTETGTWRFEDLTERQLWKLAQREGADA